MVLRDATSCPPFISISKGPCLLESPDNLADQTGAALHVLCCGGPQHDPVSNVASSPVGGGVAMVARANNVLFQKPKSSETTPLLCPCSMAWRLSSKGYGPCCHCESAAERATCLREASCILASGSRAIFGGFWAFFLVVIGPSRNLFPPLRWMVSAAAMYFFKRDDAC